MSIIDANKPTSNDLLANWPALWRSYKKIIQDVLSLEHDFDVTNQHLATATRVDTDIENNNTSPVADNLKAFTEQPNGGLHYWDGAEWQLLPIGTVGSWTAGSYIISLTDYIVYMLMQIGEGYTTITSN